MPLHVAEQADDLVQVVGVEEATDKMMAPRCSSCQC
jgi:hypothetical protein